ILTLFSLFLVCFLELLTKKPICVILYLVSRRYTQVWLKGSVLKTERRVKPARGFKSLYLLHFKHMHKNWRSTVEPLHKMWRFLLLAGKAFLIEKSSLEQTSTTAWVCAC